MFESIEDIERKRKAKEQEKQLNEWIEKEKILKKFCDQIKGINIFKDAEFGDMFITKSGLRAVYLDQWEMYVGDRTWTRVNIEVEPEKKGYHSTSYYYYANGEPESHNMYEIEKESDRFKNLSIIRKYNKIEN